ncbi:MAG: hypothetical protein AB8E87_08305 [Prochlorococcus sp.]
MKQQQLAEQQTGKQQPANNTQHNRTLHNNNPILQLEFLQWDVVPLFFFAAGSLAAGAFET